MKKLLAFLLGLLLTLAVLFLSLEHPFPSSDPTTTPTTVPTAGTTVPTTVPSVGPTTVPTATEPISYDLPMSAIVLTEQVESSRDESGRTYFTYTYPNIRLYLVDEDISEKVTLDLLNRIDATQVRAEAIRKDAATVSANSSFFQVRYSPARIDGSVLSLSGAMTSFTGGAHPSTSCIGITYDLITGRALTLEDLLTDECTADVLCRLVVDALTQINEQELLYNDFAVSVEDRFSGDFLADERWYLSREGLCFSFEPYEVGPYASGTITAVIPYHQLPGYLKDEWFPPEQVSVPGKVIIEDLSDNALTPYTSLAELNLDPGASALIIHTDSLLYHVTIETIGPNGIILFAADQLTPGYGIVVRSASPLQIRYTSNETVHTVPCSVQ